MRPSQRDIVADLRMDANDHREASWHDGSGSVITANIESDAATEIESLRARIKTLEEALRATIGEVSWFVYRKKDLGSISEESGRTWAQILDDDLNVARAALKGDV